MSQVVLGISAFYHDSAAALLVDGDIVAAAQEERFTRKKHDARFPVQAIRYCLKDTGLSLADVNYIVFYDKPLVKFERLLETYLAYAPKGFKSFLVAIPIWLKEKLYLKRTLKRELIALSNLEEKQLPPLLFTEHHQSHAASAFFPSLFEKAVVLCLDGVGEWTSTSVWVGDGNTLTPQWGINFPHSLGLLYSAFTFYTGFKVNSGEYKLMGLAPYGSPKYVDLIFNHLIDVKDDGTFRLDMRYFNYAVGLTMTSEKFHQLFGGPPRKAESEVTQKEMDIASSIQFVTEEIILKLAKTAHRELGLDCLCLAGGVALNCVANGRLFKDGPFDEIWIQPAAGDAGGALGAALSGWHEFQQKERVVKENRDKMRGGYLGPKFSLNEIKAYLDTVNANYRQLEENSLLPELSNLLAKGYVIGWFQGRMEFGPRALGGRSIIADPRSPGMQSVMNLKIKYRESFRPFAPSIKVDCVSEWFEFDRPSPYMLMVAKVAVDKRIELTEEQQSLYGLDQLNMQRSKIPAVTHVDHSARIQTVDQETNPRYYRLLDQFGKDTGCPVLINTSFNVRGEPIVCTPEDAYRCFMRTEMDYLVVEDFLLFKGDQQPYNERDSWHTEFELD